MNTKISSIQGSPYLQAGGMAPAMDPGMQGADPGMAMQQPGGIETQVQPMVEAYLSNPDPALAEEIIMTLANALGIAPPMAPQAAPTAGSSPADAMGGMAQMGQPAFKKGGNIGRFLNGLKLQ